MVVSKRYQAAKADKFASNIHKRGLYNEADQVRPCVYVCVRIGSILPSVYRDCADTFVTSVIV